METEIAVILKKQIWKCFCQGCFAIASGSIVFPLFLPQDCYIHQWVDLVVSQNSLKL